MSSDITVSKVNESTVYIDCTRQISIEIGRQFSAKAPNYKYHPKVKQGIWDGTLYFYNTLSGQLPIGLVDSLKEFANKGNYSIDITYENTDKIDLNGFKQFVSDLKLPFQPRDFQLQAAYDAIQHKILNISSSTASGKSLILYIIVMWLEHKGKKTLLLVNSIQLVEQMFGDFQDYGMSDIESRCCRIYSGQLRSLEKPIVISTYQSLSNGFGDFDIFDSLIIDEAHSGKSKSISEIAKNCINAEYRIGCSGTFPDEYTAEWFTIVGGTGKINTYSTYKSLQEQGHIANLQIHKINLNYSYLICEYNYNNASDYATEMDWVNGLPERIAFIGKLAQNLVGNTLILFTKKERHGYPILAYCKEHLKNKTILYVDGDIPVEERERIRVYMEQHDDCVLIASYGSTSTGINIKRIRNICFASGYKSRTKVLQSIGRALRKSKDKECAHLYDLVDNLCYQNKAERIRYINYSIRHYIERKRYYNENAFSVKEYSYTLNIK